MHEEGEGTRVKRGCSRKLQSRPQKVEQLGETGVELEVRGFGFNGG